MRRWSQRTRLTTVCNDFIECLRPADRLIGLTWCSEQSPGTTSTKMETGWHIFRVDTVSTSAIGRRSSSESGCWTPSNVGPGSAPLSSVRCVIGQNSPTASVWFERAHYGMSTRCPWVSDDRIESPQGRGGGSSYMTGIFSSPHKLIRRYKSCWVHR
jgi:hypothetical protein